MFLNFDLTSRQGFPLPLVVPVIVVVLSLVTVEDGRVLALLTELITR